MLECDYLVIRIDGDYVHLQQVDGVEEDKLVARALLPEEIQEGSLLHYAMLEYVLV